MKVNFIVPILGIFLKMLGLYCYEVRIAVMEMTKKWFFLLNFKPIYWSVVVRFAIVVDCYFLSLFDRFDCSKNH